MLSEVDLLSALPIELAVTRAAGKRVEVIGEGSVSDFLRKWRERLTYHAYLDKAPGTSVARIAGTDRTLATVIRTEASGYLLLLPVVDLSRRPDEPTDLDEDDPELEWSEDAEEFQADLVEAITRLTVAVDTARPAWASHYSTATGRELSAKVLAATKSVERSRARLAQAQRLQQQDLLADQLYLGTGRALELQVKEVLELLGGIVTEPEPGRDDWRASFPEGDAVFEVKGLTKSAAEKHAAQLEKWVAAHLEQTGKSAKGILIANTWRARPLTERTEPDFPAQMLPYCKGRKHSLLTGLKLFVIRAEVIADPSRAQHWRNKLLSTNGQLAGAKSWKAHLAVASPAADAET